MSFINIKITIETKDSEGKSMKVVQTFVAPEDTKPQVNESVKTGITKRLTDMFEPFIDGWYGKTEGK